MSDVTDTRFMGTFLAGAVSLGFSASSASLPVSESSVSSLSSLSSVSSLSSLSSSLEAAGAAGAARAVESTLVCLMVGDETSCCSNERGFDWGCSAGDSGRGEDSDASSKLSYTGHARQPTYTIRRLFQTDK